MNFPNVPEQRLDPPCDDDPAYEDLSDDEIEDIQRKADLRREDEYEARRKGEW